MKKPKVVSASARLRRAIDDFMAADKTLGGTPSWQRGNGHNDVRAVGPIFRDGSSTGAFLQAIAYPNEKVPHVSIGVHWDGCIWRLDQVPMTEKHRNPLPQGILSGPYHIISGPHVHTWDDNRRFLTAGHVITLPHAEVYGGPKFDRPQKWPSLLRWACGETNIKMAKDQMIDWPKRERLL
jgi:hypothetical protein